jgi:hypothetical protein
VDEFPCARAVSWGRHPQVVETRGSRDRRSPGPPFHVKHHHLLTAVPFHVKRAANRSAIPDRDPPQRPAMQHHPTAAETQGPEPNSHQSPPQQEAPLPALGPLDPGRLAPGPLAPGRLAPGPGRPATADSARARLDCPQVRYPRWVPWRPVRRRPVPARPPPRRARRVSTRQVHAQRPGLRSASARPALAWPCRSRQRRPRRFRARSALVPFVRRQTARGPHQLLRPRAVSLRLESGGRACVQPALERRVRGQRSVWMRCA